MTASPFIWSIVSVLLVSATSLLGIVFFLFGERAIKRTLLYLVGFSTGALLGDVFIHIIPEIAEEGGDLPKALLIVLGGIVFSFVMEKIIHWRHCHLLPTDDTCDGHHHDHHHHHSAVGQMALLGESMHNFIDGVVIAASFLAGIPVGISTTIAVILHEVPHEIGNFAILLHGGFEKKRALLYNGLAGLLALLGAVITLLGISAIDTLAELALPFAAGNLLYIAGSDLIPELHKETRLRQAVIQLFCIVGGIGIMYAMTFLE